MTKQKIIKINEHPELIEEAAQWFHQKWKIPEKAYLDSMRESLSSPLPYPRWYVIKEEESIIGGIGVIENDFHDRHDLYPNVCAVYVEKSHRGKGIAGELLNFVCEDMANEGITTLYLFTDHDSFYERYGWEFFCMAQGNGEEEPSRMYIHRK